jgi:hypothetical protein
MLPSNPTPTVRQLEVFERHHIALIDMHEVSQGKYSWQEAGSRRQRSEVRDQGSEGRLVN